MAVKEKAKWATTIIISSSLLNHEVATALSRQNHRVRYSDSVHEGSIIFSLSGVAFMLADTQKESVNGEDTTFLDRLEKFMNIHRNSFLLLVAAFHGQTEREILFRIQQRFFGRNLRIIPVHNTSDTIRSILTIAKATCKPYVDSIRHRMVMARAQILERSPVWEMLQELKFNVEAAAVTTCS
ncbi:protein SPO16 homolog [Protopterus annectens]|uniref:protein SPO16 homolog n=1 Tax=Protopterus annectens TaxID=7888 RepID=UPI001CFBBBCA|nr:protein SPO16 homolog [Protopterus annectens]